MSAADALIDNLIKSGAEFKNPPEVVQPHAEGGPAPISSEPEPPQVIATNDAEGRQAGDPDAPIDLPPEVTATGPKMFKMLGGDEPLTEDELFAQMPVNPVMPPMPSLSEVMAKPEATPAPPPISEQTRAEMEAGRIRVEAIAATLPPADQTPKADTNIGMAFAPRHEQAPTAPAPVMSEQTRAEMAAGKAVLDRRRADAAHGQQITNEAAAKRLEEKAPPGPDDLSYAAPRGR